MLRKKEVYSNYTPIPSYIPRQLAVDILHSHGEIITLNPLVLDYQPCKAPRDAASDEYYSTWYEITERIQYVPGTGKMGSGKLSFKGCFHDMPWGLQTHIYLPMSIDIRNTWRIAGTQPGESAPLRELGSGAPSDGLYLQEDIVIKANFTMVSFIKSQLKAASKILVERLIKKAELLDAGVLHAMMEGGRLKTVNPADRSSPLTNNAVPVQKPLPQVPQYSPTYPYQPPGSPYQHPVAPGSPGFIPQGSYYPPPPPPQHQQQQQQQQQQQYQQQYQPPHTTTGAAMELPGDYYHPAPNQSGHLHPAYNPNHFHRDSVVSEVSGNSPDPNSGRWSDYQGSQVSSRPTSLVSDHSTGLKSPALDHKSFAAELPTMTETREEHRSDKDSKGGSTAALKQLEARGQLQPDVSYKHV